LQRRVKSAEKILSPEVDLPVKAHNRLIKIAHGNFADTPEKNGKPPYETMSPCSSLLVTGSLSATRKRTIKSSIRSVDPKFDVFAPVGKVLILIFVCLLYKLRKLN
jgi:hypothetical protein